MGCEFLTPNSQPYQNTAHFPQGLSILHKTSLSVTMGTSAVTLSTETVGLSTVLPSATGVSKIEWKRTAEGRLVREQVKRTFRKELSGLSRGRNGLDRAPPREDQPGQVPWGQPPHSQRRAPVTERKGEMARQRQRGLTGEGPTWKSQMLPLCYLAWGHSVLPQTRGSHLITTKRLRSAVEWSTGRTPKHVSPGSVPLHECTLWTHTDSCDRPHEGLTIRGGRVMTALLWKLMRVVSGHFPFTRTFRSVSRRPIPVLAQDLSRNVRELGRSQVHLVSGQGGPRTSTPPREE